MCVKDWTKSMGGGGAFGNVVDKKNTWPTPSLRHKNDYPPLEQGWKLHDPLPSI